MGYALGAELSVFAVLYKSNLANSEIEQLTNCTEHSLFFSAGLKLNYTY